MATMKATVFVSKAKNIADKYKTLYIKGCFGAPMTAANKKRYTSNNPYNAEEDRKKKILAASADTFGFDCVCFIKGILWGWSGNVNDVYGGAVYKSNGVPDFGTEDILNYCSGVSADFSNIQVGEILHMSGHVGIYIGNGLAAECTPRWKDGVQITAVLNIGSKAGYNGRKWEKHGKLRFLDYTDVNPAPAPVNTDKYTFTVDKVKNGSSGNSVLLCQKLLKVNGYKGSDGKVLQMDGKCGSNTVYAIRNFQKASGLDQDGICGQKTWKALLGL